MKGEPKTPRRRAPAAPAAEEPAREHRLDGLEPDNLLAFLALLGLLRALDAADESYPPADRLHARAAFDPGRPPLRPVVLLARPIDRPALCRAAAEGVARIAESHASLAPLPDLKAPVDAVRTMARDLAAASRSAGRPAADLVAALFGTLPAQPDADVAGVSPLTYPSIATSNFLRNFLQISASPMPDKRRGPYPADEAVCLRRALFDPWRRLDRPVGLRWDPDDAKRHAYRWNAPTKDMPTTEHGASRLAVVGLGALTLAPTVSGDRVRQIPIGGRGSRQGFSLVWPIWTEPARLRSILALMGVAARSVEAEMDRLGIVARMRAERISLDRLQAFARAVIEPREGRVGPAASGPTFLTGSQRQT